MNTLNDGGSEFPVWELTGFGMSLRDYFIAHAPAEPQPWFEPKMPPRPEGPSWADFCARSTDAEIKEAQAFNRGELPVDRIKHDSVLEWAVAHSAFKTADGAWEAEYVRQRYIQWPAAWADAMLKAREKNMNTEQERAAFEAWAASIGLCVTGKYAETIDVLCAESAFKAGYQAALQSLELQELRKDAAKKA